MRISVTIDGIDQTHRLLEGEFSLETTGVSDIDSVDLPLDDFTNELKIKKGSDVIIEETQRSIRLFGGIVDEVSTIPIGVGRRVTVSAMDWKALLDRTSVTKKYENKTDKFIILDAFTEAKVTEFDLTNIREGRNIDYLNFSGSTLRNILDTITRITGFIWFITPSKLVHYEERGTSAHTFEFSDTPDDVVSFPYYDSLRRERLENFNAVEVRGGLDLSEDITDIYEGDGNRREWVLGNKDEESKHRIAQSPTRAFIDAIDPDLPDRIVVQRNTGSNNNPVWTTQRVGRPNDSNIDIEWISLQRTVEWKVAPPNFENSWRVSGRFFHPIIVNMREEERVKRTGRVLTKTINEPDIKTLTEAHDLAIAFLRDNDDEDQITFMTNKDGIEPGKFIYFKCVTLGIVKRQLFRVERMSTKISGGLVGEYSISLGVEFSLANIISTLRARAAFAPSESDAQVTTIRMSKVNIKPTEVETQEKKLGDENGNYHVESDNNNRNFVVDPSFEVANLPDWVSTPHGNHTVTITRSDEESLIEDHAAKFEITNVQAAGFSFLQSEKIKVESGDVWSIGGFVNIKSKVGGAIGKLRIEWLNNADTIVAFQDIDRSTLTEGFILLPLVNTNVPATAVNLRLKVGVFANNAADRIVAFWDQIIADARNNLPDYFDGDSFDGFWQGGQHRSSSVQQKDGVVAGYWVARS